MAARIAAVSAVSAALPLLAIAVFAVLIDADAGAATRPERLRAAALVGVLATCAAIGSAVVLARSATRSVTRSVTRSLARLTADVEASSDAAGLDLRAAVADCSIGQVGLLAAAIQRLTEALRERSAALAQDNERFRLLIEETPNAKVVVDAGGRITLVNRTAERMFGYAREDLLGKPIEVLVPEAARERHPGFVRDFFAAPQARPMGAGRDLRGRRRDGSQFPVEIGLTPMATFDGPSTLASVIDITERKRSEDELRRSNEELEQFAYVASHDLQEPLRMVANYTELLAERYKGKLDERADKYIFYAVDGAHRMQQLVADLLAYSRVGSQGKAPAPVALDGIVDGVIASFRDQIRESKATVERVPLPTVLADEVQMRQLFQNLIGNALKFRSEAPPRVRIDAVRDDGRWQVSVTDNGIGIAPEHFERVFQMFQRLHERGKYEGSGIGLAIARRIVDRHGGRIRLESSPGRGSTFRFTLLAAEETP